MMPAIRIVLDRDRDSPPIDDQLAESEIHADGKQQKENELRPPPRVVNERGKYQPGDRPNRCGGAAEQRVPCQDEGQETEDENVGIEQHRIRPGSCAIALNNFRRRCVSELVVDLKSLSLGAEALGIFRCRWALRFQSALWAATRRVPAPRRGR